MRRLPSGISAAVVLLASAATVAAARSPQYAHFSTQPVIAANAVVRPVATYRKMAHVVFPVGIRTNSSVRTIASFPSTPPTTTKPAPTVTTAYNPATAGMGAPGSFQACVAWRESTDGELSSDIYGILPYIWTNTIGFAGSPYDASLATQDAAFWKLYNMDGTSPWAPYDGC